MRPDLTFVFLSDLDDGLVRDVYLADMVLPDPQRAVTNLTAALTCKQTANGYAVLAVAHVALGHADDAAAAVDAALTIDPHCNLANVLRALLATMTCTQITELLTGLAAEAAAAYAAAH